MINSISRSTAPSKEALRVSERREAPAQANEPIFFRDTIGLQLLRTAVTPLVESWSPSQELRVWVPRCSSGHDAYSIVICLFEALESRWREVPLRVFSTDNDLEALAHARSGRYPPGSCRDLPRSTFERFFVSDDRGVSVRPFVRNACLFAQHDLTQPPPFSRIDIIAGRETLAEMRAPLHKAVLRAFHSALIPNGILLDQTGRAVDAPTLFHPVGSGRTYVARNPRKSLEENHS